MLGVSSVGGLSSAFGGPGASAESAAAATARPPWPPECPPLRARGRRHAPAAADLLPQHRRLLMRCYCNASCASLNWGLSSSGRKSSGRLATVIFLGVLALRRYPYGSVPGLEEPVCPQSPRGRFTGGRPCRHPARLLHNCGLRGWLARRGAARPLEHERNNHLAAQLS